MKNKVLATVSALAIITSATVGGMSALESLEGNSLVSYRDVVGVWTGCGGVTLGMKEGMVFTPAQCKQINQEQFESYVSHVYKETGMANIPLLTAHGLFAYNIGKSGYSRSQVLTAYRQGNLGDSCHAMMNWNGLTHRGVKYDCNKPENAKVKGCKGIVNRRTEEVRQCLAAIELVPVKQCGFWCQIKKIFNK